MRLPVSWAGGSNVKPSATAVSPMYCSTALIPTKSSTSLRLQPSSHGAGQTRPICDGNGLASVARRNAYSCQLMPSGGFSSARTT